jgi:hypothetical protein
MTLTVKYNSNGETAWARVYDSDYDDVLEGTAVDAEGNVVVAGWFSSLITGTEVLKYDPTGRLLWARLDSADTHPLLFGVTIDDSGYIIGVGTAGLRENDALLIKLSPYGESLWARTFDMGGDFDFFQSVQVDWTGDIVVAGCAGNFTSGRDAVIAKYTPAGELVWLSRLDFGAEDGLCRVAIDPSNNVVAAGATGDTWPGPVSGLVVKLTSRGDTIWSRLYSLAHGVCLFGVTLDLSGNMLLAGTVVDSVGGQEKHSCLVMMCDSSGDTIWTWQYGAAASTSGCDLALDDSGHVYVFGGAREANDDYLLMKLRYGSGVEEHATLRRSARARTYAGPSHLRPGRPLQLMVDRAGQYEVALFDALGQKVVLIHDGPLVRGAHGFTLGQIPAGVYVLRVSALGSIESQRLVVVE